ncbi:hypothetical protein HK100_002154 [Physocladia obscura]|uniref:Glutathione S-transferase n=1 Tax=Physocladia obscura TaxID=109957 RepID=A0AAD5TD77_9FUNG|nr:hypothetical protein HK100_002154 [Physocladia obscura]
MGAKRHAEEVPAAAAPASPKKHAPLPSSVKTSADAKHDHSSYEVHYFGVRGKGELPRIILAYGGATWKNEVPKSWAEVKDSTPFGQLPLLVEKNDGKEVFCLAQSRTIARYLASKFDLIPKDPTDAILADSIFESIAEIDDAVSRAFYGIKDEEAKKTAIDVLFDEKLPSFLKFNERFLVKNGKTGFYFSNKISLPELFAFVVFEFLEELKDARFESLSKLAPTFKKLLNNVRENTRIAKYLTEVDRAPFKN